MKSFRIKFTRRSDDDFPALWSEEDTKEDSVEFDLRNGDETGLLQLFGDFLLENNYELLRIDGIEEVPYQGARKGDSLKEPGNGAPMSLHEAIVWLRKYQGYMPIEPNGKAMVHSFDLTDETVDRILAELEPLDKETDSEDYQVRT